MIPCSVDVLIPPGPESSPEVEASHGHGHRRARHEQLQFVKEFCFVHKHLHRRDLLHFAW